MTGVNDGKACEASNMQLLRVPKELRIWRELWTDALKSIYIGLYAENIITIQNYKCRKNNVNGGAHVQC